MLASLAARTVAAAPAAVTAMTCWAPVPVVPVGHEYHALGGRHLRLDARGVDLRPR